MQIPRSLSHPTDSHTFLRDTLEGNPTAEPRYKTSSMGPKAVEKSILKSDKLHIKKREHDSFSEGKVTFKKDDPDQLFMRYAYDDNFILKEGVSLYTVFIVMVI
jgi:hypothetical protein